MITGEELIDLSANGKLTEEQIQLYLDSGGDINYQYRLVENALESAVVNGHIKITHLLLKYGADPTIKNRLGHRLIFFIYSCGRYDKTLILLNHKKYLVKVMKIKKINLNLKSMVLNIIRNRI